MKRRVLSVILSAAMALSLASPVMAEPSARKGAVKVENVPGGVLIAVTDDGKVLPVGEEVELDAGTKIHLDEGYGLGYYVGDAYHRMELDCAVASSSNAQAELTEGGTFTVENGQTTVITGEFKPGPEVKDEQEEIPADAWDGYYNFDPLYFDNPEDSNGKSVSWEIQDGFVGNYGTPIASAGKFTLESVTYDKTHIYGSEKKDVTSRFTLNGNKLSWTGQLEYGRYMAKIKVDFKGGTHYVHPVFCVGQRVEFVIPLVSVTDSGSYDGYVYHRINCAYVNRKMTLADAVGQFCRNAGMVGYTTDGWKLRFSGGDSSEKLEDTITFDRLKDDFAGDGAVEFEPVIVPILTSTGTEYKLPVVERPEDRPAEKVPETNEELAEAVDSLPVVTEGSSAEAREEFDRKVEAILDGIGSMEKSGEEVSADVLDELDAALAKAFGVEIVCDGGDAAAGVISAKGLMRALGLTSFKEAGDVTKIRVGLKDGVATSADASKRGEFTVEITVVYENGTNKTLPENGRLDAPIEVAVTLPEDLVASMSDAAKTYVLKIGGREVPYEMDADGNTITFTTDRLGVFTVGEAVKKPQPSGGGSAGGGTSANRNASGNWVQSADGRWWFQYTGGGYPAGKWEMIKDKWYYFNADGYMASGWQLIDGVWYHLDELNGDMNTGWYYDAADGKWYYFNAGGAMQTGWQLVNGLYYYLTETAAPTYTYDAAAQKWVYSRAGVRPYGSMYANETTPDGYMVGADGARIR